MTDKGSMYERMERVVRRYQHAHGKRVFMADVMLEMIATELDYTRCEFPDCGNAGVRVIIVDGYNGEVPRETVCVPHVGPMIARKQQGCIDNDLPVPAMRYETV